MKSTVNPFMPNDDSPKEQFLVTNMIETIDDLYSSKQLVGKLPNDFVFSAASFDDDNVANEIFTFMNTYLDNLNFDDTLIRYYKQTHGVPYIIRYKSTLVCLQIVDYVTIRYNDEEIPSIHADILIIHPKFRKHFLLNVFTSFVFIDAVKRGCKVEFLSSHEKLHYPSYVKKTFYHLMLSELPFQSRISGHHKYVHKKKYPKVDIRKPTFDELSILNTRRYKLQIVYSEEMLKAFLDCNICYTDGKNMIIFTTLFNFYNKIRTKAAVIVDYIIDNSEDFNVFFANVVDYIIKDSFDMITTTVTNNDDLIKHFDFEKDADMYYYMLNFVPKVKRNEVMLTFR